MTTAEFRRRDGTPVPAVSAGEMREVDRVAVQEFGIGVLQMMEHAGRALAGEVLSVLGGDPADWSEESQSGSVTILAGNGGNGGGGLCCARHLANRGVPVAVVLDRDPGELDGPAAHHHETLAAMELQAATGETALDDPSLLVDALVGYGLSGPLRGKPAELVARIDATSAPILSLDVPSGLDATTGERSGPAVDPDRVLTLALPKTGLSTVEASLRLADIGIPAGVYEQVGIEPVAPFGAQHSIELVAQQD